MLHKNLTNQFRKQLLKSFPDLLQKWRWCSSFKAVTRAKILNNTEICNSHLTPEISLRLITPNCKIYNQPIIVEEDKIFENDPFWGFYWPGGQALSRYILDNPLLVKSKTILDVGSGSGACTIAAILSGAKMAIANDIDNVAIIAAEINGQLNNMKLNSSTENLIGKKCTADVILLGDIFYDEEIAELIIPWLFHLKSIGKTILIGDPGRHPMTNNRIKYMEKLQTYELSFNSCTENHGFKFANVWSWIGTI